VTEFDPDKAMINRHKHGLNLTLGVEVFDGPFIEEEDDRVNYGETRFLAIGPVASLGDRICAVVYTWRGNERRLISFRKANDKEVGKYRQSYP
jgi:uncharacterized DUF497 family protein